MCMHANTAWKKTLNSLTRSLNKWPVLKGLDSQLLLWKLVSAGCIRSGCYRAFSFGFNQCAKFAAVLLRDGISDDAHIP